MSVPIRLATALGATRQKLLFGSAALLLPILLVVVAELIPAIDDLVLAAIIIEIAALIVTVIWLSAALGDLPHCNASKPSHDPSPNGNIVELDVVDYRDITPATPNPKGYSAHA